ncbi:MAG: type IV secretion system DNA-binding domain-containing protein [Alphaproteobacteria bacterium]|jgi:type IV secretory pathway TraG/TraD family ATPase VirD4|nr:type IV secretion system DNA-binding domain-containing protein [Alphaproteobacteria bacterium]
MSTKVVFSIEGAEIAEHMSKWLGVQEVSEAMENISYGMHQMRDGVSLVVTT